MTEFYETSQALLNSKRGGEGFVAKYPWRDVPLNKSFIVKDKKSITLDSLRTLAFRTGKRLRKKFKVFEHNECYEVARLPYPDDNEQQGSKSNDDSSKVKLKSIEAGIKASNDGPAPDSTWGKLKAEGKV